MSITDHLHDYLPERRWFAGKGHEHEITRVTPLPWLADPSSGHGVRIELVEATYADGATDVYQLPLSYVRDQLDSDTHGYLGEVELDGAAWHVYDAAFVHEGVAALLEAFRRGHDDGTQQFRLVEGQQLPDAELVGSPLTGEQSNTSIAYGDEAILKVFRRVAPGGNPDIEIHERLTRVGNVHVAPLLGWIDAAWPGSDGEHCQLGMLQMFLTTATDGWTVALSSVRDLLVEEDLDAAEVGGDLFSESERLGEAVASVHTSMAEQFETATFGPDDMQRLARAMHERLDAAVAQVPELAEHADALHERLGRLTVGDRPVPAQRVHGDLHLGQTLRTVKGWKLIDFEGEPMKSLEERRGLDSPMRDVAGMLRSLDYAAGASLQKFGHSPHYEFHARQWYERNREAFLRGYAEGSGADLDAATDLLVAYEADKAVYEAVYEARNRPGWLQIPLHAIARIASTTKG